MRRKPATPTGQSRIADYGQTIPKATPAKTWLEQAAEVPETDESAETIADALWYLVQEDKLMVRRGGYVVRRGRGRVIVEPAGE